MANLKSIEDFMRSNIIDVRLSVANRWMYWDNNKWVVREQRYRARTTTVLIETEVLEEALLVLAEE